MTIAELFAGRQPALPWRDPGAFLKAAREEAVEAGSTAAIGALKGD